MQKAKYVSELKRCIKSSSGKGSRDVAVLQNDACHMEYLCFNQKRHVPHGTKPPPNASALM